MAFVLNYVREFPGAAYHLVKKAVVLTEIRVHSVS
jgi:hypothetical protein